MKKIVMMGFVLALVSMGALSFAGVRQQNQQDAKQSANLKDSMNKDTLSQDGMLQDKTGPEMAEAKKTR